MNERELDRAIDVAAGTLMAREPSRALPFRVMARVRERAAPAPWRFGWIAAAATIALCAAIATAVVNQGLEPAVRLPRAAKLPIAEAAAMPALPIGILRVTPEMRVVAATIPKTVAFGFLLQPEDASTIEPIETEPIALSTIEVPQLERETTSVESISIEPITIAPLSASND